MNNNFSEQVKDIISFSREQALRLGNDYIGTEHFLLGLIQQGNNAAISILQQLNVDLHLLRETIEKSVKNTDGKSIDSFSALPLTKEANNVIRLSNLEASSLKSQHIEAEHLMLALLKNNENAVSKILNQRGVDYEIFHSKAAQVSYKSIPKKILITDIDNPPQYLIDRTMGMIQLFQEIYYYSRDWCIDDYSEGINNALMYCSPSPLMQNFIGAGLETHDFFLWFYLIGINLYKENWIDIKIFAEKYYDKTKINDLKKELNDFPFEFALPIKFRFEEYLKSEDNKLLKLGLIDIENEKIGLSAFAKELLNKLNIIPMK